MVPLVNTGRGGGSVYRRCNVIENQFQKWPGSGGVGEGDGSLSVTCSAAAGAGSVREVRSTGEGRTISGRQQIERCHCYGSSSALRTDPNPIGRSSIQSLQGCVRKV